MKKRLFLAMRNYYLICLGIYIESFPFLVERLFVLSWSTEQFYQQLPPPLFLYQKQHIVQKEKDKTKVFALSYPHIIMKTSFKLLGIHLCTIIVNNSLDLRICRNISDVVEKSIRFDQLHFAVNDFKSQI